MNKEFLRREAQQTEQVNDDHHERDAQPGLTASPDSKRHAGKAESLLGFFQKPSQPFCTKNAPYFESIFIKGCHYILHK